jgi:hypothetical protein
LEQIIISISMNKRILLVDNAPDNLNFEDEYRM